MRAKHLLMLADIKSASNADSALHCAQSSLALARRIDFPLGIARGLQLLADIHVNMGHYAQAQDIFQQSIVANKQIRRHDARQRGLGNCYLGMGNINYLLNNLPQAARYYRRANDEWALMHTPLKADQIRGLISLAGVYRKQQDTLQALRTYRLIVTLATPETPDTKGMLHYGLQGMGQTLLDLGRLDSARYYLQQSLQQAIAGNNAEQHSWALAGLAHHSLLTNQAARAEGQARQALQVSQTNRLSSVYEYSLNQLALAQGALQRPEAYQTMRHYVDLHDTLMLRDHADAFAGAQARFNDAEQQAQIRALQQDRRLATQQQELIRLRARQQLAGLGGAAALLLLGAGFLFWRYRQRQAAARAAAETLLRQQIAADLHDDVGSLLTQVSLQSDLLSQGMMPADQHPAELQRMASTSREAVRHMSDVVWGLSQLGHAPTLGPLLDRMRDHAHLVLPAAGLDLNFPVDPALKALPVPTAQQQVLFLIFKEALHNAVKHALGTTEVTTTLRHEAGALELAIRDDGQARAAAPTPRPGHGLANMAARAQAVGGSVRYEVGEGFGVVARLPLG